MEFQDFVEEWLPEGVDPEVQEECSFDDAVEL